MSRATLCRLYDAVTLLISNVSPGSATYRALCQLRSALEDDLDLPRTPTRRRP